MLVHQNTSLKPYNTFGIDVNAMFMAQINEIDDLEEVYSKPEFMSLPKLVLGGGSNVLFTSNQRKVVLKIGLLGFEIMNETDNYIWVKVGAGEIWHQFVQWCVEKGYGGVENLSLIPGTVGAAPLQNIGAYGVELKDVFDHLEAFHIKSGEIQRFTGVQCKFGYRHSIFKGKLKDQYIVTAVVFKLNKKPKFMVEYGEIRKTLNQLGYEKLTVKAVSQTIIHIRQAKLPDPAIVGNAGSFFKNPIIELPHFEALKTVFPGIPSFEVSENWKKIPAAWLIDQCGWKGKREGNVGVHEQQALVIVNHGEGTGKEVLKLSKAIQESVQKKFGVELSREVNVL